MAKALSEAIKNFDYVQLILGVPAKTQGQWRKYGKDLNQNQLEYSGLYVF